MAGSDSDKLASVVFAHDNYFLSKGPHTYSSGAWFWERYLTVADAMTVVARGGEPPSDESVDIMDRVDHPAVEYCYVPNISSLSARATRTRAVAAAVARVLDRSDALIARLPSEIGLVAISVARRLGKPWAIELAGCPWNALWNHGRWEGKAYAPISRLQTARAVRRAPYVLYVTQQFLQRRYPTSGRSIACSDVELPPPDASVLDRRLARSAGAGTPFRIGIVGFMSVRYKGIDTALRALSLRKDDVPPVELALLGPGETDHWRALAEELGVARSVSFEGKVRSGAAVLEWLDSIDLYLHPTLEGGLPRALLEAMSRGCPALGSTAGGIPEVLPREVLHDPGDAQTLGDHLVRAAGDAVWRQDQARRNFEVAAGFARDRLSPRRDDFWREFAAYAKA